MNIDILLSLVRHLLTLSGGVLVSKGVLNPDTLNVIIGALISIGGVVWGAVQKLEKPKTIIVAQPISAKPTVSPSGVPAAFDPSKQP